MLNHVAVFTPLPVNWPHPLLTITRGIRILNKPSFATDNWDYWNLRRKERTTALERTHWLCLGADCELHEQDTELERLAGVLRRAILGFQLWCLMGWDGITIQAKRNKAGTYDVEGVDFAEPYPMSQWSKMTDLTKLDVANLSPLVEGALVALESGVVRIVNPFQFLEIGLQVAFNHVRAGALLWTMGLDGLLAAEKQDRFESRLNRLLGKDTPILPEDWAGRRPTYRVGDVAANMYKWRGLIAHGKELLQEFRKPIQFQFEPLELAHLAVENWTYEILLFESCLFTLLLALRRVITEGKLELLRDKKLWEKWLDSSAELPLSKK